MMEKKFMLKEVIILVFILSVLLINISRVFPPLAKDLMYIVTRLINYPNFSYEDKMKEKVGIEYYDWTELVREHTSINSKVMHPPQMWPWGQSGNPEFSQYFLYPAKLIRENRLKLFQKDNDITHVIIAWGEGNAEERAFGWPKFPVFAQKIYYLPQRRKVEIKGLDGLQEWMSDAQRTVNTADGRFFDLSYTSSQFDYWIKPVNFILLPGIKLSVQVKSNWPNSTALVAKVSFGKEKFAVFSSFPNQKIDEWETLNLNDLYFRAYQFAKLQGWAITPLKVEGIGLDTGHPAKMPYLEKWGVMEVEKGGTERLDFLNQQSINSQTLLSLANIYSLEGETEKSFLFYQKASFLEPANPWPHYGLAQTAEKLGLKGLAMEEYEKTIEIAPEISWFYFSLGEFYRKGKDFEKAIIEYQKSLELSPEDFWSHLALGEVYEDQNLLDLAYQHYDLASKGPRQAFSSDGKIAWEKARKIELEQNKTIEKSLEKIKEDPDDWEARLVLGKAYVVLGLIDKAKEQYKAVYKSAPEGYQTEVLSQIQLIPPVIVDQLSRPIYGSKGKAVETALLETKLVAVLDNYHSYIQYFKEFFPIEEGTIEFNWKPPVDFTENNLPRNLIYQFNGLFVWINNNQLNFALFDPEEGRWEVISYLALSFSPNQWYQICVSYGDSGMFLFMDGTKIAESKFKGTINDKSDIYLGRGPLWSVSDNPLSSGYFETIKVYDYQKLI